MNPLTEKMLMTGREINTADYDDLPKSWYAPCEYFKRFPSVKLAGHYETCSSAGDWEGYILQLLNGTYYLITFSQVNNWPCAGFSVYTGGILATCKEPLSDDECQQIISDILFDERD